MAEHVILVSVTEPFASSVSDAWLESVARRVLEAEGVDDAELSVAVTDDDTVRSLNREYAGEDTVTDVLSFSQREGEEFASPPDGTPPLGEVVIAYPQAARQAAQQAARPEPVEGRADVNVQTEVARLLIHGILHLLGYDHSEAEEERRMRAREDELEKAIR